MKVGCVETEMQSQVTGRYHDCIVMVDKVPVAVWSRLDTLQYRFSKRPEWMALNPHELWSLRIHCLVNISKFDRLSDENFASIEDAYVQIS